jgi:predicted ATPase
LRGDPEMMRQLAEDTRRTSQEMKDEGLELAAYRASGYNGMYFGEFEQARTAFETILRVYNPNRHRPAPVHYVHDPKYYAIAYLAVVNWILGFPDQARTWQAVAFEYASELNQAVLAMQVKIYGGAGLSELLLDLPAVRAYADEIVQLADQHDLHYFRLSGLILRGWVMAQDRAGKDGLSLMHRSVAERLALGVTWFSLSLYVGRNLPSARPHEGWACCHCGSEGSRSTKRREDVESGT